MKNAVIILLLTLVFAPRASSQTDAYLLPWQTLGVNDATVNELKLKDASQALAGRHLGNYRPLSKSLNKNIKALNAVHHSSSFIIGSAKSNLQGIPFIQPILCQINSDQILLIIQSGDLNTGLIWYTSISEIPLTANKDDETPLSEKLVSTIQADEDITVKNVESALKIKLALKRSSNSSSPGVNHCPNLILGQKLSNRYRIQQVVGTESTRFLRQVLPVTSPLQKHNRTIHIDWHRKEKSWDIFAEISESVFGQKIYPGVRWQKESLSKTSIDLPQELETYLTTEEKALDPSEAPRVASVYGAWAYLDKGRAWGLQMRDRVYISTGEKRVKGHVVGYYGPRKGLVSPSGYPISEGAIVFIRTGQKKVRIGDTLVFDPTKFPTPWPPVKTPIEP